MHAGWGYAPHVARMDDPSRTHERDRMPEPTVREMDPEADRFLLCQGPAAKAGHRGRHQIQDGAMVGS